VSTRTIADRLIIVRPMNVTGQDDRGNDVLGQGDDVPDVPARRRQLSATEDLANRDEQVRTFVYFLELFTTAGTPVTVKGRDRLVDGDDVLEVQGIPEVVSRRYLPHHIEARAYVIEG
jgi:hypothetical protein